MLVASIYYRLLSIPALLVAMSVVGMSQENHEPVFPVDGDRSLVPGLLKSTQLVRELSEEETRRWVPSQSGFRYVDCPNCNGGRQENQLQWFPQKPNELRCRFCDHRFPSDQYPSNQELIVRTPKGEMARYPYWGDRHGYRHFFAAKRDDEAKAFMADQSRQLALLYQLTKDPSFARRSAVILHQFAVSFPNWCYHFDYPHRQKEVFEGEVQPKDFRAGYRTSRWTWWAYSDIPIPLLQAFDWIRPSGVLRELSKEQDRDVEEWIANDLLRNACEQVMANRDDLTNMSPTAWKGLIQVGRVLPEPRYVHEPIRRLQRMVASKFFYDGFWAEGSPDYGRQSLGGLEGVIQLLHDYSDPKGYRDPMSGERYDRLDLTETFPGLALARDSLTKMRLPNGRYVPVHDSWSKSRGAPLERTEPFLLPALGHACLGGGEGLEQTQFHLTWSGGYGHSHADNLSLLLSTGEREHLSDLGYTHTAYRAWTLATAAHNTVVIDGRNQSLGGMERPSDGTLELLDLSNPRVQVVKADGVRAYQGLAKKYSRTLLVVNSHNKDWYGVDLFEITGGTQHDYFLHGDADRGTELSGDVPSVSRGSLVPQPERWVAPKHEGETSKISEPYFAYGFLRDLKQGELRAGEAKRIAMKGDDRQETGVRITLLPDQSGELIVGTNPSIRQADEDDAKLDRFTRPFVLWRQTAVHGQSRFLAVLEPTDSNVPTRSIVRREMEGGGTFIEVEQEGRTDWILLHFEMPTRIEVGSKRIVFEGSIGVVSWSGLDELDHCYLLGKGSLEGNGHVWRSQGSQEARLHSVEDDYVMLEGDESSLPKVGAWVRFITEDSWVYPFQVKQVEHRDGRRSLSFYPDLPMTYDDGVLKLQSFPQREHPGRVMIEWNQGVSSR